MEEAWEFAAVSEGQLERRKSLRFSDVVALIALAASIYAVFLNQRTFNLEEKRLSGEMELLFTPRVDGGIIKIDNPDENKFVRHVILVLPEKFLSREAYLARDNEIDIEDLNRHLACYLENVFFDTLEMDDGRLENVLETYISDTRAMYPETDFSPLGFDMPFGIPVGILSSYRTLGEDVESLSTYTLGGRFRFGYEPDMMEKHRRFFSFNYTNSPEYVERQRCSERSGEVAISSFTLDRANIRNENLLSVPAVLDKELEENESMLRNTFAFWIERRL